jgi:calpain-7
VLTGCYTNNPHVLVRYDIHDIADMHLALVLSQYKKSNDLNYTLSCYCTEDFVLSSLEKELEFHTELSSKWTTYTAGGPIGCDTYHTNPQYSILVPPGANRQAKTEIQVKLSSTTTTAVNALLVPVRSYGDTYVKSIGPPIIDTGNYRHGFVVSNRTFVPPGAYTLIVSNFHAGQTSFFTIKVSSNSNHLKVDDKT